MKRTLSLILAVIMTVALFAGCNQSTSSSSSKASTASSAGESKGEDKLAEEGAYTGELPLSPEKVTLKFATHQGSNASMALPSNDLPIYQKIEELTNVHIEWETVPWDTYKDIMTTRLASGSKLPDVLNLNNLGNYETFAADNIIIPQTELIEKYAYWTNKFFDENPSYKQMMTSPDGNIYAIEDTIIDNFTTGIMVNKFALERAGIDKAPTTLDEFYNMLKAFKDKDINGNGKADEVPLVLPYRVSSDYNYLNVLASAFGMGITWNCYVTAKDGKVVSIYDQPEYREFIEFVRKLYAEDLINKDLTTITYDKIIEYVTNGQCGAVGYWSTYAYLFGAASPDAADIAENQREQTPIYIPLDPIADKNGDRFFTKRVGLNGDGMGITVDCPEELRPVAMKWIDFLFANPISLEMQSFGVEGLTYKKNADGTIEKIQPESGDWGSAVTAIGGNQPPRAFQQLMDSWRNSWLPQWLDDVVTHQNQFYRDPTVVPIKWTAAEEEIYMKHMPDIDAFLQENVLGFVTGTKSMDDYDAFLKDLNSIGMDKYIEIFQSRYDRQISNQ